MISDVFTDALHELQDMCKAACAASHDAAFPLERKYQEGRSAALAAAVFVLESAVLAAGAEGAACLGANEAPAAKLAVVHGTWKRGASEMV